MCVHFAIIDKGHEGDDGNYGPYQPDEEEEDEESEEEEIDENAKFGEVSEIRFPGEVGPLGDRRLCKLRCVKSKWVGPLCATNEEGKFSNLESERVLGILLCTKWKLRKLILLKFGCFSFLCIFLPLYRRTRTY